MQYFIKGRRLLQSTAHRHHPVESKEESDHGEACHEPVDAPEQAESVIREDHEGGLGIDDDILDRPLSRVDAPASLNDEQRAPFDLVINPSEVFTQQAERNKLNASEK